MMGKLFGRQKDFCQHQEGKEEYRLNKKVIYVTGLPRSGSTLLCQLLGMHPQIYSIGHSSPLCEALENLRHSLSDNQFLLSQLDVDFDLTYHRLLNSYRGFVNCWFAETDLPYVADKNREWLGMIETVNLIDPDFRMLVCLRDPVQIFGSIESQHKNTLLLDFPDHMAPSCVYFRADTLFKNDGVVGGPLRSLENLQDLHDERINGRIFYVSFEALVNNPIDVMKALCEWMEAPAFSFDPENLPVKPHESDSYYRFKYRHETFSVIKPLVKHEVSERIAKEIYNKYKWYYENFYPDHYPHFKT